MKSFDEYQDGEWVVYQQAGHPWHLMQFQAFKSKFTHNAFRLKFGNREVIADIGEISPLSEVNKLIQEEPSTPIPDLPKGIYDNYSD